MNIRKKIREQLKSAAAERTVTDVRIGLGYTAVMLDDGRAGVAFTFHQDMPERCSLFKGRLPLEGRKASEVMAFLDSQVRIETAMGLATANALANVAGAHLKGGDVLDYIGLLPEDRVGMVGMFGPLIGPIRKTVKELLIFEKDTDRAEGLQPASEILGRLPECQVAFITATSIVNHSMDEFLHAAAGCREVVILGASTPLVPAAFKDTPVTCLSGVVVSSPSEVLRIVSSAGGMRHFKGYVQKVNLPVERR